MYRTLVLQKNPRWQKLRSCKTQAAQIKGIVGIYESKMHFQEQDY